MSDTSVPVGGACADFLFPNAPSVRVVHVEKRGPVLQPAPQFGDNVLALNLPGSCFHRCAFCPSRGASPDAGNHGLGLYGLLPERIEAELAGRNTKPRAVFISPQGDPFPPQADIQTVTARVIELLARQGIESWLMTRGLIRPFVLERLEAHRHLIKLTLPITTLRRDLQRALEPVTAPPRLRLRQLATLDRQGFRAQVALEPLVPALTDTTENLEPLLRALADLGVESVTASYLFLRDGTSESLSQGLGESTFQLIDEAFAGGPILYPPGQAAARFLPRQRRERGYANLMALASTHGISVRISRLGNPDFGPASPPRSQAAPGRLLSLFLQGGKVQPRPEDN